MTHVIYSIACSCGISQMMHTGGELVVLNGDGGPFQGGKTRHNRRRRRNRRSLKRKYSKRR